MDEKLQRQIQASNLSLDDGNTSQPIPPLNRDDSRNITGTVTMVHKSINYLNRQVSSTSTLSNQRARFAAATSESAPRLLPLHLPCRTTLEVVTVKTFNINKDTFSLSKKDSSFNLVFFSMFNLEVTTNQLRKKKHKELHFFSFFPH